jgi:tripartite-type tricarboxylate transporter receptor subunit TctC
VAHVYVAQESEAHGNRERSSPLYREMQEGRMKSVFAGLVAVLVALTPQPGAAQNYPEKPIRFIVPYAAGGTTDLLSRAIAQKLAEAVGQPVVPDNRPGAGGNVGAEIAAKSPPDGYTMLMAPVSPMAINVTLYGNKMSFNPEKDFAPVTLVAKVPLVLVVHPSVPVKNLQELIALAKSKPGQLNYGSAGNGSSNHLVGEMFKTAAGIEMVHIPFRGGGPGMMALVGGQIDLLVGQVPTVATMVNSGRLRAIAVSGAKRSPALPEVPTMAEAGLPGFDATAWYSIAVPAGTPKAVISRLHAELVKILKSPDIRERLISEGADVETSTPEELVAFIRTEIPKWAKAVKDSGSRID